MTRLVSFSAASLLALAGLAAAQPTTKPSASGQPATALPASVALPAAGDSVPPNGVVGWPSQQWLYDSPAITDAAGKIVIHWFCAPKLQACVDDLARLTTLRENSPRVYVIAYINGTKRDAQKLDPIRESEGVGRGTVAYGKNVGVLFKKLGVTGPASLVVDVDSKVQFVTTGSSPSELDARDAKANALAAAIKEYTTASDGPKQVAAQQKFSLAMTVKLANWLVYSKKPGTAMSFQLTAPKDIQCDRTSLTGDQLKPVNQTLTAQVSCSGPRGSYEVRGQIDFRYDTPGGATGLASDAVSWKFEIK